MLEAEKEPRGSKRGMYCSPEVGTAINYGAPAHKVRVIGEKALRHESDIHGQGISYAGELPAIAEKQTLEVTGFNNRPA